MLHWIWWEKEKSYRVKLLLDNLTVTNDSQNVWHSATRIYAWFVLWMCMCYVQSPTTFYTCFLLMLTIFDKAALVKTLIIQSNKNNRVEFIIFWLCGESIFLISNGAYKHIWNWYACYWLWFAQFFIINEHYPNEILFTVQIICQQSQVHLPVPNMWGIAWCRRIVAWRIQFVQFGDRH